MPDLPIPPPLPLLPYTQAPYINDLFLKVAIGEMSISEFYQKCRLKEDEALAFGKLLIAKLEYWEAVLEKAETGLKVAKKELISSAFDKNLLANSLTCLLRSDPNSEEYKTAVKSAKEALNQTGYPI